MKAREDFLRLDELSRELEALKSAAASNDLDAITAVLRKCVHGFQPETRTSSEQLSVA